MRKRVLNIILLIVLICSCTILGFSANFAHELYTAPQLLVHVINPPNQYYVIQDELVAQWEGYCIAIIVFSCALILFCIATLVYFNFLHSDARQARREARATERKASRIAALEKELEDLKKDGE